MGIFNGLNKLTVLEEKCNLKLNPKIVSVIYPLKVRNHG